MAVDTNDGKEIQERLARSEARLAEAQRIAHVGSWEWDVASNTVSWTDEMFRIYGLEKDQFPGTYEGFLDRVLPGDREHTQTVVFAAFRDRQPFVYDHRIVRSDGQVRMLHTRGEVTAQEHGKVVRLAGACWDITDLWQASREREQSISLLRATLEATADGLLVVDRSGKVAAWNQRLLDLWNVPRPLVDKADFESLLNFVHDQLENGEECLQTVRRMEAQPEAESFDSLRFRDGHFFERYSRPQRLGDEIVGRVWSYRDVTEREWLYRRAQDALAARDEFLSVAAHEIRGPLTSLHLAVEGLRLSPPEPVAKRMTEIIAREDRRIGRLLDEILDATRIRSGQLDLVFSQVDLVAITRDVAALLAPDLKRSGSSLSISAPGQLVGTWDRSRLQQIVTNLLSNAIKFGEGRPIEIRIENGGDRARFVIRDQGIGIAAEAQQRLFTPFERAIPGPRYGGLGLGLYTVRTILDGLDGSVRVDSAPAAGATFTVELPLARAA